MCPRCTQRDVSHLWLQLHPWGAPCPPLSSPAERRCRVSNPRSRDLPGRWEGAGPGRAPRPDWPVTCEKWRAGVHPARGGGRAARGRRSQQCSGAGPGACGARGCGDSGRARLGTARTPLHGLQPGWFSAPLAGRACPSVRPSGVGRVRLFLGRSLSAALPVAGYCLPVPVPTRRWGFFRFGAAASRSPLQPLLAGTPLSVNWRLFGCTLQCRGFAVQRSSCINVTSPSSCWKRPYLAEAVL